MAATNYTPIQHYRSTTPGAVPAAGDLAAGELAINTADEKLYFKNASGSVKLLATSAITSGTVTSVSGTGTVSGLTLTGNVTTSGSLTLGGTLTLTSGNVTTALGYTPANAAGQTFTGSVIVRTGSNGYVVLTSGGGSTSGLIEFLAPTGNRQGYIGLSSTLASADAGTIPYVAGIHAFNGAMELAGPFRGNVASVAASDINCSVGNYFVKTVTGPLTWTFSNAPTSLSYSFLLELTNGGSATQTWPASVDWPGGVAPTLTVSGVDMLGFITDDSGTTWRGVMLMQDSK